MGRIPSQQLYIDQKQWFVVLLQVLQNTTSPSSSTITCIYFWFPVHPVTLMLEYVFMVNMTSLLAGFLIVKSVLCACLILLL